ncbi:MAG TPA: hypothetical protein VLA77_02820 [Candidatus Saccharimonadales bacterium]|nr:hypothetical protein [Candidatus Saccharimonadales bacterium]
MSEILQLTARAPELQLEAEHSYFKPPNYIMPEIGTPITVKMFEITDDAREPKEMIEPLIGLAARCKYGRTEAELEETLAIRLDEESVKNANLGEMRDRFPARVQAVQPGIHTVLVDGAIRRFAITVEVTSHSDISTDQL